MIPKNDKFALVAGGGGFIGGHLAADFLRRGYQVRCVDVKPLAEWEQLHVGAQNLSLDLSEIGACRVACQGVTEVYNLACDMGGIGFIENHKALCMLSVLINTHLLLAANEAGVRRYLFTSSACVYNADKQSSYDVTALKEEDAYPAMPEDGYGWEKLFSERMCRHFREDFGLETRVVRLHNVYGPFGTWTGGREKAPAAICRKVLEATLGDQPTGEIEIWGTGEQTRSFTYIDDCVEGLRRVLEGDFHEPVNIGSSELVSINELVDIVEELAEARLERTYRTDAPKGVNGRNSDNTLVQSVYGWQPSTPLREGMRSTFEWIRMQMLAAKPELAPWPGSSSSTSTTGPISRARAST